MGERNQSYSSARVYQFKFKTGITIVAEWSFLEGNADFSWDWTF